MNLPPSLFYKLAMNSNFAIIDKLIYNPKILKNTKDYFSIYRKKIALIKGLKLEELEKIYFSNHKEIIKKESNKFIKEIIKEETLIKKDVYQLSDEIQFLEFFLSDILKKKKKKKIRKIKRKKNCILEDILSEDYFIWNRKIYRVTKKEKSPYLKVKGKKYSIEESIEKSIEDLEREYQKQLKERIIEELTKGEKSLTSRIKNIKEKKEIYNFLKKKSYFDKKEKIGFKICSQGFFITSHVEPYILFEPKNKRYYRFNKAIIGVQLERNKGKIKWKDPVVINDYIHPALASKTPKPFQKICNGEFSYYQATKGKKLDESIRIILAEAKRMLQSGYFGKKGAWNPLYEPCFESLEVAEFDPKEVTNK